MDTATEIHASASTHSPASAPAWAPVRVAQDRLTIARLMGAASGHAARRLVDFDVASAELSRLADGRADLLGEAAGTFVGMGKSDGSAWYANAAARLCIAAGGDEQVARAHLNWLINSPGWKPRPMHADP